MRTGCQSGSRQSTANKAVTTLTDGRCHFGKERTLQFADRGADRFATRSVTAVVEQSDPTKTNISGVAHCSTPAIPVCLVLKRARERWPVFFRDSEWYRHPRPAWSSRLKGGWSTWRVNGVADSTARWPVCRFPNRQVVKEHCFEAGQMLPSKAPACQRRLRSFSKRDKIKPRRRQTPDYPAIPQQVAPGNRTSCFVRHSCFTRPSHPRRTSPRPTEETHKRFLTRMALELS